MTMEMIVNLVVLVLLAAAIGWAIVLDRRLRDLRAGRDGVKQSVLDLSNAAARAEAAVAALRQAAEKSGAELATQQTRAKAAADELGFLVSAAEGLAGRLTARGESQPVRPAATSLRTATSMRNVGAIR